jgi:hypothetical protein
MEMTVLEQVKQFVDAAHKLRAVIEMPRATYARFVNECIMSEESTWGSPDSDPPVPSPSIGGVTLVVTDGDGPMRLCVRWDKPQAGEP